LTIAGQAKIPGRITKCPKPGQAGKVREVAVIFKEIYFENLPFLNANITPITIFTIGTNKRNICHFGLSISLSLQITIKIE